MKDSASNSHRRVLLLCHAAITERLSGPGVRYWEFAHALSAYPDLDVTLATVPGVAVQPPESAPAFRLHPCRDEAELSALAARADVVVTVGAVVSLYPALRKTKTPLVLDLYIPLMLEELQRTRAQSLAEQSLFFGGLRRDLATQMLAADFVLCASEKQRDYWLGAMSALGRVNPYTHGDDPTLRRLIAVVPFGLPSRPPRHTRQVLKGVYAGIAPNDKVVLWGGGVWDWLDAPTLIRAMARLADRRPEVKLFFMGIKHTNPQEIERKAVTETIALSRELGLEGRTVFFNDWVPYAERESYLLEADVGVSLHRDHLETRFSFRTRFLDCVWAGLPIVATRGDVLSDQVKADGLGEVVEPNDVDGVTQAILKLLDTPHVREAFRPRFEQAAAAYRWDVVTRPLAEFCRSPHPAPDKTYLRQTLPEMGPTPWWGLPGKAWSALRAGGVQGLARQVTGYRRWLLNRQGRV